MSKLGLDLVPCRVIHSCSGYVPGTVPGPACSSEERVGAFIPQESAVHRLWKEGGSVDREPEVQVSFKVSDSSQLGSRWWILGPLEG